MFQCVQLSDGSVVKLRLLDTAGQEKFNAITESYYKQADCCLLVYDITNKDSFDSVKNYYVPKIKEYCNQILKVVLLGNKADLEDQREVSQEQAEKFADSIGCKFYEGSAKSGENIKESLDEIAKITYLYMKDKKKNEDEDDKDGVILDRSKSLNDGKKKKCC